MKLTSIGLWFLCAGLLIGCATTAQRPMKEGESPAKYLFETKCSRCHSTLRAKWKRKTEEGWENTVMRMKNEKGAPINDEEAQIIIDYLVENYGK